MVTNSALDPALSLGGWIDSLAASHGNRPALFADESAVSFQDLAIRSRRLATGLSKIGVRKGDRVAVWLPNVTAWVEILLACSRLGAIVVALNTRFRSGEVSDILRRSKTRVLVYWPGFRGIPFADILADIPSADLEFLETVVVYDPDGAKTPSQLRGKATVGLHELAASEPWHGPEQNADAGCLIITTSGTTSRPKFVLHSQRGLASHSRDVAAIPGFYGVPGSVGFALMPLCGAFGLNQTLAALAGGAPTVLQTAFEPLNAAAAIRRYGVTTMAAVDEVFYKMLDVFSDPHPFPSLRYIMFGSFNGSPLDFIRTAEKRALTAVGAYGMSEFQGLFAMQSSTASVDDRARNGGTPASPQARVRVRDIERGHLLPPGEVGELEVSAPSMMLHYFGDEQATSDAFTSDGFLRTGDSGMLVADGTFQFIARMGDTLRLGGFLVSPVEISTHLETHPAVHECQVVAANGRDGYKPVAFVIPAQGAHIQEPELMAHCSRHLAKYKVPVRYFALDEFPMADGPNGKKVQRAVLRGMAEQALR